MKKLIMILIASALSLFVSCKDNGPVGGNPLCPSLRIIAPAPYWQPVWHPSGTFIAFGHSPLYKIDSIFNGHCFEGARYLGPPDSSGFWLIDTNGMNERMVFQFRYDRFDVNEPAWSRDGEWIAFQSGAQIFKIHFTGTQFDTTTLQQLTNGGRNFFPSWSPDGQWIAYDATYPEGYAGLWIIPISGFGNLSRRVTGGRYPDWSPTSTELIYIGLYSEIYHVNLNDTLPPMRLTAWNQSNHYARDNRAPKYSQDGTKIAFWSQLLNGQGNIWIMDSNGSNPHQLTFERVADWLDWNSDGRKIVYVSYRADDWSYANGVLWTVDVATGERKQLTFNTPRDSL